MAFRHWAVIAFAFLLLFAHFALFMGPIAIIFASIVFGRQEGNRIDVSDNKIVLILMRVWLSCIAIVFLFWLLLLLVAYLHFSGISW